MTDRWAPLRNRIRPRIDEARRRAAERIDEQPLAEPFLGVVIELVVLGDLADVPRRLGVRIVDVEDHLVRQAVEPQDRVVEVRVRLPELDAGPHPEAAVEAVDRVAVLSLFPEGRFAEGIGDHLGRPDVERQADLVPCHGDEPLDIREVGQRRKHILGIRRRLR